MTEHLVVGGSGQRKSVSVPMEALVVEELCASRRSVDRMVVQAIESKEQILAFRECLEQIRDAVLEGNRLLGEAQAAVVELSRSIRERST